MLDVVASSVVLGIRPQDKISKIILDRWIEGRSPLSNLVNILRWGASRSEEESCIRGKKGGALELLTKARRAR